MNLLKEWRIRNDSNFSTIRGELAWVESDLLAGQDFRATVRMGGRWEEEWWRQERKRNVTRPSSLLVVCYEEKEHSSTFEWLVFRSGKGVLEGRYDERKEQNRPRKSSNNAEDFNETSARRETIPNFYARGATKTKKREEKNKPKPGPTQLLPTLQLCERPVEKFPPRI